MYISDLHDFTAFFRVLAQGNLVVKRFDVYILRGGMITVKRIWKDGVAAIVLVP